MKKFIKLQFPEQCVQIRERNGIQEIFDPIRKVWIMLNPEEWVRQHIIQFLLLKDYPASLIAVEKKVMLNELVKRCDIVVYSRNGKPFMIIECKRMEVPLTSDTLAQILRYHIPLQPTYLVITNGVDCIGLKKENDQFQYIDHFPEYDN